MKKIAIIIQGPPGSGKGTQAELFAKRYYGFIHFDTGHFLERILREPGWQKDPILRRERKLFDEGKLCTGSWVLEKIKEAVRDIHKAGFSVILSGSPRSVFEAFGEEKKKQDGLIEVLKSLYGKPNIFVVSLEVKGGSSTKRNSHRFVCSVCGLPVLAHVKSNKCAFCMAPLRKRSLDNREVIKIRLAEYKKRTYPMFEKLQKEGYKITKINGEPAPFKVQKTIIQRLRLKLE